jgi:hypothetical protein
MLASLVLQRKNDDNDYDVASDSVVCTATHVCI